MSLIHAWSQTVTIAGISARVRDMSINESAASRTASISFTLEAIADNSAAFDAAEVGAAVEVEQSADGETITNQAEIRRVTEERGRNWTQKRIEARGLEIRAKGVRFQRKWTQTAASTIVEEAWNDYGTSLGYTLDLDENTTPLDISSSYDTLFDVMEEICRRTNWAWRIRDDKVQFFDPTARTSPAINQADNEIQGGTIRVDRSIEQLVNKCRTQGYIYRTKRITVRTTVLECKFATPARDLIPPEQSEWEVVGQPKIISTFDNEEREVTLRQDDWLEFSPPLEPTVFDDGISGVPPADPGPLSYGDTVVEITHRRKVWFVKSDAPSVSEFGTREGQALYGDGGMNEDECNQVLTEHLARWAQPTVSVDLQPLVFGHIADSLCLVTLTDPSVSGTLYVTEVRRTVQGSELTVQLSLASPQTVLD